MARLIATEIKTCTVKGCRTRAKFQRWSCGCVEVEICDESNPCPQCSDYSALRERCGQKGSPESHAEK